MKIKLKNLKELIKHEKTKEGYCLDCNSDGCILDQLGEIEVDVMQWVMDKDKLAKEIEKELRKEFFSSPEIAEVSYFENNNEYDTMFKRWARAVEERLRGEGWVKNG